MNENADFTKTKKLARITKTLCRVAIISTRIGVALLLIATILAFIVPAENLKPLVDSGQLSFNIGSFVMPANAYQTVEGLQNVLLSILGTVIAGAVLLIICAKLLIGLLKSVENGTPFEKENSRRLRLIGLTLIIGSVAKPIVEDIPLIAVYKMHQLENMHSFNNLDFTLLLCGLLILVLSGVFAYGAYLQRDHDQTV